MPLAAWIGPAGAADVARQVTIVGIIGVGMTMVILNLGNMFELDAIAAVVIGGTIIGALIIGVLNNGMILLGVSSFYQLIIKGLIISLAVWCDVLQKRNWRA